MTIYFVGIKGVGMAGLAVIAKERGFKVSGSDLAEEFVTDKILKKHQIQIDRGFTKDLPAATNLVVYTGAHQGKNNPQVKKAIARKIAIQSYGEAVAEMIKTKRVIAVAGTHGKTTTTAMVAKILKDTGFDPGYLIGAGAAPDLGAASHFGAGDYFVLEADEYPDDPTSPNSQPKFLRLKPFITIVLATEYDHPDIFATPKHYYNAYKKLVKLTSPDGIAIIRGDEPFSIRLIKSAKSKTKVKKIYFNRPFVGLRLKIPGRHNLFNATAAAFACRALGVDTRLIKKSLNSFSGVERRMQLKSDRNVTIYDDYSHHPTEIQAALQGLREFYPKNKIIVVFQSHTVSRTRALLADFGKSFQSADEVIVAPIFLSAREKTDAFSGADLAAEIIKHHPNVCYLGSFAKIIDYLNKTAQDKNIIVTMGAGDIYQIIPKIIDQKSK